MAAGKRRGFCRAFTLAEGEGYGRNPACGVPSAGLRPNSRASPKQKACCPCAPVRIIISIRTWGRALFGARPHVLAEGEGFGLREPCRYLRQTLFRQSLTCKRQQKARLFAAPLLWRKVRDSNPRTLAGLQFSRLTPSTTLPTFRKHGRKIIHTSV